MTETLNGAKTERQKLVSDFASITSAHGINRVKNSKGEMIKFIMNRIHYSQICNTRDKNK